MNKKNILAYSIKWFAIIVIVAIVIWQTAFDVLTRPKDTETIEIFLSADSSDADALILAVNELADVKKVNIYTYSPKDTYYAVAFATTGLMYCDLVVMNEKYFETETTAMNFAPLSAELLSFYGVTKNLLFVHSGEAVCAITVFDKENGINLFGDKIKYADEEKYCIAVSVNRPNAAPYSQQKESTDNAFKALAALLNKY